MKDSVEIPTEFLLKAENYFYTFDSPAGKRVLDYLRAIVDTSTLSPTEFMTQGTEVNPSEFIFIREGQNQVIKYIEMMIKYYKDNK